MVFQKTILDLIINDLKYAESTLKRAISSVDFGQVITTDPITDIRRVSKVMVDFHLRASNTSCRLSLSYWQSHQCLQRS